MFSFNYFFSGYGVLKSSTRNIPKALLLCFIFSFPLTVSSANNTKTAFTANITVLDTGKLVTPVYWEWSTVWGGQGDEAKPYIDKGTDNSIFVAGSTEADGNGFLTTPGVHQEISVNKQPLFISRFDSTGQLIYSTFVGMSEQNFIRDFQVFGECAYIMYDVPSGSNLSGQTLFDLDATGNNNTVSIFAATVIEKIDATGNLAWSTVIDGNGNETGFEFIVNDGGVWFYTGSTSTDLPTYNAHQPANAGNTDHFVGRLGLDGQPAFATYYGGTDSDEYNEFGIVALAAHDGGMAFAGYYNSSTGYPVTVNPINYPNPDPPNTITNFNADGTLAYSLLYGQAEDVQPVHAIDMDENGNLYVVVHDYEFFMPTTPGAFQEYSNSSWDIHLGSLDDEGNLNWGTFIGGSSNRDYVRHMEYEDGHIVIAGETESADFPTTAGSAMHNADGFTDVFVASFAPDGTIEYSHLYGGTDEDNVVNFDTENGCASLLINQEEEGFPVTSDPLNSLQGDNNLVMRLNDDGSVAYSMPIECFSDLPDNQHNYFNPRTGIVSVGERTCYISFGEDADFPTTEGAYFNDNLNGSDLYLSCVGPVPCPDTTAYNTTNTLSPTLVTACQDGTIPGFTGTDMELLNDSLGLIAIYKRGTPVGVPEGFLSVKYQWQAYNEITLKWENVSGAITKDFLPPPTSADVDYRRAAFTSNTACDTLFSNVVSVEVESSTVAPTLPPDSIYQKCAASTISIDATATGGAGGYTYSWSPTTGLSNSKCGTFPNCAIMEVSVTESTIYIVSVTDALGCVQTEQYTVNVYDPLVNAGPDKSSCDGTGVQLGTPHIAPGTGTFSYNWTPNDGTLSCTTCPQPIASPTVTTTYTVEVTGPDACTVSDMVTLSVVTVTADAGPDSIAVCMGDTYDLGEAYNYRYTYGWAPLNYLDNALTAQPEYKVGFLPSPNPYQYTVTKTHNNSSCQDVDTIKVYNLQVDAGPDGCGPRTVGTPDPHGFPVVYDWTIAQVTGGTTADVSVSCTDCAQPFIDYDRTTVQVWMSVCVSYLGTTCCDTVWLPDCLCPFPDPEAISDAGCAIANPFFNTTLVGGGADTANFDYVWTADTNGIAVSNPLGIPNLNSPLPQTITQEIAYDVTYTLTTTYKLPPYYSCTGSVEIYSTNLALPASMATDTNTCIGQGVPIGSFGTAGWSASWTAIQGDTLELNNPQIFNPTFTPTAAGTYIFEVTVADDVTGCSAKDTATIEVIEVVADAGEDILVCNQAIIQIGASSIPDLVYSWEPVSVSDPTIAQPTDTIYANTEYRLLVTDSTGGCPQRDTVQITVVSPPSFDAGSDVEVCEGGSIQIGNDSVAGQAYLWSPTAGLDDATISNPIVTPSLAAPGSQVYTVTITNENPGCSQTEQVIVSVLPSEFIDAGTAADLCVGEMLQIGNALNTGTIQWSPTDYLDNATIAQPTVTLPLTGVTDPITYTITIDYPSGCQQQDEVIITPFMAIADAGIDKLQCEGSSVEIGTTAQTGYTYSWTPTIGVVNPTAAMTNVEPDANTTYTITAISPEGCEATDMVTVTYQTVPVDAGADVVFCPSTGAVSIGTAGTSGYSYAWSPSAGLSNASTAMPTATVNVETEYILTVTHDATGCENKDTVLVSPNFEVDLGNDLIICPNDEVTIGIIDPLDGTTFSWSPGAETTSMITVMPSTTTTYTLSATKSGCTITDNVKINVQEAPNANAGSSTVICAGACTEIGANPTFGFTYAWYPATGLSDASIANPVACPSMTTTYTLTVVNDITNCVATSTVTVAVSNVPAPPVDAGIDQSVCPGESIVIGENTQTGYTYNWTPTTYLNNPFLAQPTWIPAGANAPATFSYYLTMTDNSTGCFKQDTVTIELDRQPNTPTVADVSLCAGSSVELCPDCVPTSGHSYLWSPAASLDDPTKLNPIANPTETTFYTLMVTETGTNCTATVLVEATVTTDLIPTVEIGDDLLICEGESAALSNSTTGDTYEWGPADLTSYMTPNNTSSAITFTPPDTGIYNLQLTVTNANGCTDFDMATVAVRKEAIANAGNNQFICSDEFALLGTPTAAGTGTWTYESGPSTPVFGDINDANTLVTGLTPGIHVFKWTVTGNDICNSTIFDAVTLIYEDPEISLAKNKCEPNGENYNVIVLIENGSLYSVNEGVIGMINEYTTVSDIDSMSQLQVIAVSNGNCRDTSVINPPACIDCLPIECLPVNSTLIRGKK